MSLVIYLLYSPYNNGKYFIFSIDGYTLHNLTQCYSGSLITPYHACLYRIPRGPIGHQALQTDLLWTIAREDCLYKSGEKRETQPPETFTGLIVIGERVDYLHNIIMNYRCA